MDRHEADEQLRKAIADHSVAYDLHTEGELLDAFIVIASWMPADYDGDRRTAYTTHLPDGYLPNHVAIGLAEVGKRHFIEVPPGDGGV